MTADVLFGLATVAVTAALIWGLVCSPDRDNGPHVPSGSRDRRKPS